VLANNLVFLGDRTPAGSRVSLTSFDMHLPEARYAAQIWSFWRPLASCSTEQLFIYLPCKSYQGTWRI